MISSRTRVVALVTGGLLLLGCTGAVAVPVPNPDPCQALFASNTIQNLQKYEKCRLDRIEKAIPGNQTVTVTPAPAPAPVTVTAPPVTVTATVTAAPTTPASPTPTATPTATATPTPTVTPTSTTATTPPATGGVVVLGRSFPDASTTGVPAGITPTPYTGSCTLSDPNAAPLTINAKIITCDQFRILQPGVTITNSIINGTVYSDCCYLNGSFTIVDSEIKGPNSTATVVGEARFKLLRVEVTGGSRSINCNIECDIRDSYIHGQYGDTRGIDHESGIRQDSQGTFIHNNIACDAVAYPNPGGGEGSGCSAAISGYGDFGTVNNNTFTNNLISSGESDDGQPASSYCIYGGSTKGKPYPNAHHIVFQDNILMRGPGGKCGIYGPVNAFDSAAPGNVWTNNVYDDGTVIPAAN